MQLAWIGTHVQAVDSCLASMKPSVQNPDPPKNKNKKESLHGTHAYTFISYSLHHWSTLQTVYLLDKVMHLKTVETFLNT
jgi:hypothetical protein